VKSMATRPWTITNKSMDLNAKIYIAAIAGLGGTALSRNLLTGFAQLRHPSPRPSSTSPTSRGRAFFAEEKPTTCSWLQPRLAASIANNTYPAEFIRDNLAIQTTSSMPHTRMNVKRLLFLGSSCIYPKLAPQPMKKSTCSPANSSHQPPLRPGQDRRHRDVAGATTRNRNPNPVLRHTLQPRYGPGEPEN